MNAFARPHPTSVPSVEELAKIIERRTPRARVHLPDPSPDFGWQAEGESLDPYYTSPFGLRRTV
jgi:hypothetical protein